MKLTRGQLNRLIESLLIESKIDFREDLRNDSKFAAAMTFINKPFEDEANPGPFNIFKDESNTRTIINLLKDELPGAMESGDAKKAKGTITAIIKVLTQATPQKDANPKEATKAIQDLLQAVKNIAKKLGGSKTTASGRGGNQKVKDIQTLLNKLNENNPTLDVDGKWGGKTTEAWEKCLKSNRPELSRLKGSKLSSGFTNSDVKLKWADMSKILSSKFPEKGDLVFKPNIDGMLDLLQFLAGAKGMNVDEIDDETRVQLDALGMGS